MQEVGCIACALNGKLGVPADIHHILSGGKRISHDATVALCPWHHRGTNETGLMTDKQLEEFYGPSLARNPKEFYARYGSPSELLEIQKHMLDKLNEVTTNEHHE